MRVEFFRHSMDDNDIKNVNRVLKSIFLTTGEVVKKFERGFASYTGLKHAVGFSSCTGALHMSLSAWEIGKEDEVITTPMSFCATSNAIIHAGAIPVFADAEESTGNINADLIEKKINKKTRAIIPVHLYGQMCDMVKIRKIADKYDLTVIEDAAHCIEGRRDGVGVGILGDAACFSFYATKNITAGEGGAVVTDSRAKAELLKMLRLHGIDKSAGDRYTKKYRHWDMPLLGWKYNMDNIQAAMLTGQLARIDKLWKRREKIAQRYEMAFGDIHGIKLMKNAPGSRHARHMFTIQVSAKKRDTILALLQDMGVGVAVNYRPIHLLKYYRKRFDSGRGNFPVAEDIGNRTISLPLYPKMKDSEVEYVIRCVKKTVK